MYIYIYIYSIYMLSFSELCGLTSRRGFPSRRTAVFSGERSLQSSCRDRLNGYLA